MDFYKLIVEAHEYASLSTCADKHVGCLLLNREKKIIAKGFNHVLGMAQCDSCVNPNSFGVRNCPAVHAEISALMLLTNKTQYERAYYAICTLEPCIECTKALALSGVKEVYYDRTTNPNKSGRTLWKTLCPGGRWESI